MKENLRKQQLHDDTLATLGIASEMVTALYRNLCEALEEKDREIERLRERIAQLTTEDSHHDSWLDFQEPASSELCADTSDVAEMTRAIKPRAIRTGQREA